MSSEVINYLPILVQVILATSIAVGLYVFSYIFGQRAVTNKTKDSAYECGLSMEG